LLSPSLLTLTGSSVSVGGTEKSSSQEESEADSGFPLCRVGSDYGRHGRIFRTVAKLMRLTGMMASEIAALKKTHIRDGYFYVEESIVRGVEDDELKTEFRERRILVTMAIRTS